jgi:hypothetical protein
MTVFVINRINPRATRMIVKDQNGCDLVIMIDLDPTEGSGENSTGASSGRSLYHPAFLKSRFS